MRESTARSKNRFITVVMALSVSAFAVPAFSYDRIIDLEGTTNTRDIGGYLTGDMRTIRTGQIIRSEKLSRLTASDFQKLEELGVKTVIDLRTDDEVDDSPTVWQGDSPPQFFHYPIIDSDDDWLKAQKRMMKKNRFSEKQSLAHMAEGYRVIAETGTPGYEKVMDLVLDQSNWPILVHCSAGKDRSGIAVALIMEALGVDRETIMEDYLLTNEVGRSQKKAELLAKEGRKNRTIGRSPSASAWYPIVGVKAEMLEAFYAGVEEQHGSMDAYLTQLGLDPDARAELAASLTLERPELTMAD